MKDLLQEDGEMMCYGCAGIGKGAKIIEVERYAGDTDSRFATGISYNITLWYSMARNRAAEVDKVLEASSPNPCPLFIEHDESAGSSPTMSSSSRHSIDDGYSGRTQPRTLLSR